VQPEFVLTAENAETVARICTRVDGLPLALELAAARVSLLPPRALLLRLDQGLHVLTSSLHDLPARQRTMRDAIAWSHALLDEEEPRLFARLAVFVGGCTLDAIEAICGDDGPGEGSTLDRLGGLLDSSLVYREPYDDIQPRFAILETIRDYAREQLVASGGHAQIERRHAHYYRGLAIEGGSHLTGPEQVTWLTRLHAERHNLRAAIELLQDRGEATAAIDVAWALWRYWWLKGLQREARRRMEGILDRSAAGQFTLPPLSRA
jgi:predicted ATPase